VRELDEPTKTPVAYLSVCLCLYVSLSVVDPRSPLNSAALLVTFDPSIVGCNSFTNKQLQE